MQKQAQIKYTIDGHGDAHKLPVKSPADLIARIDIHSIPKIERIDIHELPVLKVEIGFWERLAFFTRKVVPYVYDVLRFYSPIPLPSLLLFSSSTEEVPMSKTFWQSKTFWLNLIFVGFAVFGVAQDAVSPETVTAILAGINIVLRFITKTEVMWTK